MTDEKKPAGPKAVADDKVDSAHKLTRRRFTKAGVVAPLIMTLASRPVWGQDCTFSGGLSGNASRSTEEDQCLGSGLSPSRWLELPDLWWPTHYENGIFTRWKKNGEGPWQTSRVTLYFRDSIISGKGVGCDRDADPFDELDSDSFPFNREFAAAVLNTRLEDLSYGYTEDELYGWVCDTHWQDDETLLDVLEALNGRGAELAIKTRVPQLDWEKIKLDLGNGSNPSYDVSAAFKIEEDLILLVEGNKPV